ncbi:MAG: gephyrin-like molybdotransferase Glp [Euryarchaeota archaeon]|nr:gephyrin-like molybdotransferase Glp [Euryarchaeota archaeon]
MSLFLEVVPVKEARTAIRSITAEMPSEVVQLTEAYGRILAVDLSSDADIPGFSRSVVDGYAVVASDTAGAGEAIPAMLTLTGRVLMGNPDVAPITPGECVYVPTGGVLPAGADAMTMIEYCEELGDEVLVHRPVAPGENIIHRGEDFSAGEVVLKKGRELSPRDLGVLAAVGHSTVRVIKKPTVGIISTGNELVPVTETPKAAEVRDANTYLCSAFVLERSGIPVPFGIIKDDRDALRSALKRAIKECDMVMLSGGSSKDDRDMCADIVHELGTVLVHGIAIAPGKPTIIGRAEKEEQNESEERVIPIIGLPGHPASAYIVLIALAGSLLSGMSGKIRADKILNAKLTQSIPSARGREDYVRVTVDVNGSSATPVFGKSGLLNTLIRSQGIVRVPAELEGFETGEDVDVILW